MKLPNQLNICNTDIFLFREGILYFRGFLDFDKNANSIYAVVKNSVCISWFGD